MQKHNKSGTNYLFFIFYMLAVFVFGAITFLPQGEAQEINNNLIFAVEVAKQRGALYERPNMVFEPGDWVSAFSKKVDIDALKKYQGQNVHFIYEFLYKGSVMATHTFQKKFGLTDKYFKLNILPDPFSTTDKSFRWDWSGNFAAALAKLPAGVHEITVTGYIDKGGDRTMFVKGTLGYNNKNGNEKMSEYAKGIEKEKGFDIAKQNEEFSKKHGRASDNVEQIQTTVFNNCGREVVINFANKKSSTNNVRLRNRESLNITINEAESIYISWKGKSAYNGPTIGSFESGKIVNLCK